MNLFEYFADNLMTMFIDHLPMTEKKKNIQRQWYRVNRIRLIEKSLGSLFLSNRELKGDDAVKDTLRTRKVV